ncbi:MBL fold metallo-hydrolase [Schlesneria paludicola]|uniref:MBL fold metallo-hydrolase n=1 Tax=Schlesneria paludicola TaxID=360056 RepID=UPI00029A6B72|nr:MBL fold metallo-hydrolase [Schlesneria paludicola]
MRLLFLGTGGYHPNERRHTAGIMLPELGILFDAGSSAFRVASHLATQQIDIFLTHAHLDHVQGLTYLLVPLARGQITHCRVHASPDTIAAVKEHLFSEPLFPVLPAFEFLPLTDQVAVANGQAIITHQPLHHPGGSVGYRLQVGDKKIAYITDTTVSHSYVDFVRGVDLLIHECYFPDAMADWAGKTGHSYTSQVASLASEARVTRMYLTHIDPQRSDDDPIGLATARAIFPETYLAEDLMELEI